MDDDAERQEEPPAGSKSGRVRIIGAEPAGQSPGRPEDEVTEPGVSSAVTEPGVASPGTGADASSAATDADPTPEAAAVASPPPTTAVSPEMPHWTEAPTGEVPAVLARDPGPGADDPWSSVPGPTWREEHQDWVAHEESFEPSMLAFDDPRRGSLDEEIDAERQPWAFDLPGSEAPEPGEDILEVGAVAVVELNEPIGDDTLMVPAVGPADPGPERIVLGDVDGTLAAASVAEDEIGPGAGGGAAADVPPVPRGHRAGGSSRPMRRRSRRMSETEGAALAAGVSAAEAAGPEADRPTEAPSARPVPPAPPPTSRPRTRPPSAPSGPSASSGGRNERNMGLAVATGLVLIVLALIVFHLGTVLTMILVTILVTIAAAEAYAAVRRGGYHPANLVGLVATVSLMVATYNKGQAALPLVTVLLVACALLWYVLGVERVDAVRGASATVFVFAWVGVFGSYAALLLDPTLFPRRHGIAFLLGALICGAAYDIGALAVGRGIGRHPMAPSVSPNKTWEGALGGAVASIAAGVIIVHFIHPWTLRTALELGIVVAVVAPLGDLFESAFKRSLGLKDMSRILPGHGGLLDRVDGLLFILPATYYLVKAVHLG